MNTKAFRIVIAIPYEAIIHGDSVEEILEQIESGDADALQAVIESGIPMVDTLADAYGEDTTVVEPATVEDQERILGEVDPEIESTVDGDEPGPLDDEEDEDEDSDDDDDEEEKE